jgi:hypothetical protein
LCPSKLWANFILTELQQQLNALKADSDIQKRAATEIATLQKELADTELARRDAVTDARVYSKVVQELKKMVDQLLAQVTPLETKVGVLSSTVIDRTAELHAKAIGLEWDTAAKVDFQKENARLTKKLKGESLFLFNASSSNCLGSLMTSLPKWNLSWRHWKPLLRTWSSISICGTQKLCDEPPKLLDSLLTQSREVIHLNLVKHPG